MPTIADACCATGVAVECQHQSVARRDARNDSDRRTFQPEIGGGTLSCTKEDAPERIIHYYMTERLREGHELTEAVKGANLNTSGGFLQTGSREAVIRIMGRASTVEDTLVIVLLTKEAGNAPVQSAL